MKLHKLFSVTLLVLSFALFSSAHCMNTKRLFVDLIVKNNNVEKAQIFFSGSHREHFSDVVLMSEVAMPYKNIKAWFLFAAYETDTEEAVWGDELLRYVLFPKPLMQNVLIQSQLNSQRREKCPHLTDVLWWFVKNDLHSLCATLDNEGPQGNAFPTTAEIIFSDEEILEYIQENKGQEEKIALSKIARMYNKLDVIQKYDLGDMNTQDLADSAASYSSSSFESSESSDDDMHNSRGQSNLNNIPDEMINGFLFF